MAMSDAEKAIINAGVERGPMNLICKLAQIRREIDHIPKTGENAHFRYKFMEAAVVAGIIGDKLAEANIVIAKEDGTTQVYPMSDNRGFFVLVECYFVFVDGDTGERLRVWSCGAGTDSQDKGPYKAQTGALKYALTQALCMRVGDDPEDDSKDSPSPRTPTTEATRPVYEGGRVAEGTREVVYDPNAYATPESQANLHKLVMKQTGESAAWATSWIQQLCKTRWGMTTTSDGQGGQRLTNKLQNRHVQELTKMVLEDPAETF